MVSSGKMREKKQKDRQKLMGPTLLDCVAKSKRQRHAQKKTDCLLRLIYRGLSG